MKKTASASLEQLDLAQLKEQYTKLQEKIEKQQKAIEHTANIAGTGRSGFIPPFLQQTILKNYQQEAQKLKEAIDNCSKKVVSDDEAKVTFEESDEELIFPFSPR